MKWTTKIPRTPGYYWWRCGVEKEVLRVTKSDLKKSLFAEGGEYAFEVEADGESEWCYIPEPK